MKFLPKVIKDGNKKHPIIWNIFQLNPLNSYILNKGEVIIKKKYLGYLIFSFLIILTGCAEKDSKKLTRVYFQLVNTAENSEETWMILDEKSLSSLDDAFKEIKWEPNTVPSKSRKENLKVTLFWEYDNNLPELLKEYSIWFNEDNSATILSKTNEENFGDLDSEYAKVIKDLLLDTSDKKRAP
ncbi:hypothetical protein ACFPYN_11040 [Paenisporosarcina macmurdoensis]|uniref:DUF4825 domain-containing protein n=1 Tax=Paenisporosarcina macmurdoensis TaxID=212659 RepID=A0ABW1L921_9BACL